MANKYLIHGAAFDGDGTSANEAASAGAIGAWNTINYAHGTTPTYGTLAAGDTVYIRSKTSADANLTITPTAAISFGLVAATEAAMVKWVIDNGAVWSGVDGVITYDFVATSWAWTLRQFNHLYCATQDSVVFKWSGSPSVQGQMLEFQIGSVAERFKFDGTAGTGNGRWVCATRPVGTYHPALIVSPHFALNRFYGYNSGQLIRSNDYTTLVIDDPLIEINDLVAVPGYSIFAASAIASKIEVNGGRLSGSFLTTGFKLVNLTGGSVELNGFEYPNTISDPIAGGIPSNVCFTSYFQAFNADDFGGSEFANYCGMYTSRADNNPPVLNAVRPDSGNSAWSLKVYPQRAHALRPLPVRMAKMYTAAAAALGLTVEMLVATTLSATDGNTWLRVTYIDDTTGAPKTIVSKCLPGASPSALAASTATWSATTWGAISFDKRKISITTPTTVRQNTVIEVSLLVGISSITQNDILFVCPDVQIA